MPSNKPSNKWILNAHAYLLRDRDPSHASRSRNLQQILYEFARSPDKEQKAFTNPCPIKLLLLKVCWNLLAWYVKACPCFAHGTHSAVRIHKFFIARKEVSRNFQQDSTALCVPCANSFKAFTTNNSFVWQNALQTIYTDTSKAQFINEFAIATI